MRFVCFLLVVIGVISCGKKEDVKSPYVISKVWNEYSNFINTEEKDRNGNVLPPPPPRYKYGYGYQNFIIDDSLKLYYYQLTPKFMEKCIVERDDTIPYFQDLKPEMLIEIPLNSINDFVKLNFKKGKSDKVKIASTKDTLNSEAYFNLVKALDKYLDFSNDNDVYAIFPTTQEEDTILYYKKNKDYYFSSQIKWDLKRVKFFDKPKVDLK